MTEEKKGMLASFLRLIAHGGRFLVEEYWYFVKRSTLYCFLGLVIGLALVALGAGREPGSALVPLGTFVAGVSFVVWLTSIILITLVMQKASQKLPLLGMNLKVIGTILFMVAFTVFYFAISGIYAYPWLLEVGLGLLALVMLSMVLGDGPKKLSTINFRIGLVFMGLTVVLLYLHLPNQYQSRVFFTSQVVGGMTPNKVEYTLEGLRRGEPAFFKSVSNPEDQAEPNIWYYFDEKEDVFYLYDKPGRYPKNGDVLLPATHDLQDIIIEHEQAKKSKEEEELKVKQGQDKAVADMEAIRLKAEEENRREAQQKADELVRQQAEAERATREAALEEQRQLARQPVSVASTILEPGGPAEDTVIVLPIERFTYRGTAVEPAQSSMTFDIVGVRQTPDNNKYEVTLQPRMLVSRSQKYDISRQAEPVQLIAQKDNSNISVKTIGGIGASIRLIPAGKVYIVVSHGRKFQLTAGGPIPPIIIKPAVP